MFKKTSILLAATVLFAFTVPAAMASTKCTVKGIENHVVTLDCGKKAARLKIGDKVKVNKKAVEGC